ncbi:hypothetical protein [Halobacillus mangrovi]|nr:hypothetical protein [Halobacillus mangrovi]
MNLIVGILLIAAPTMFLYYWGKSGYDWGTFEEDRKKEEEDES